VTELVLGVKNVEGSGRGRRFGGKAGRQMDTLRLASSLGGREQMGPKKRVGDEQGLPRGKGTGKNWIKFLGCGATGRGKINRRRGGDNIG